LGLADFPCFDAITGNFFKKWANNRGFSGALRRNADFPRVISMACAKKFHFPVLHDNRAFLMP
jgi:hypothetical protein